MASHRRQKRKYEKRLHQGLSAHKDFLIQRLQEEWNTAERAGRREEVVRKVKAAGLIAGKTILILLAVAGVVTVATVAPNIFAAFGRSSGRRSFFTKEHLNRSRYYLRRQNYIHIRGDDEGNLELSLTPKGMERVQQIAFEGLKIKKPEKWDGLWRVVIFDIPNRHKWAREGFRAKLKIIGLYPLQKSVFITPYPCEEEISFLASLYNVKNCLRFIKTPHLSDDQELRDHFGV